MAVPSVAVLRGQLRMSQTGADYRSLGRDIPLHLYFMLGRNGLGVWLGAEDQTGQDLGRVRPLSSSA